MSKEFSIKGRHKMLTKLIIHTATISVLTFSLSLQDKYSVLTVSKCIMTCTNKCTLKCFFLVGTHTHIHYAICKMKDENSLFL